MCERCLGPKQRDQLKIHRDNEGNEGVVQWKRGGELECRQNEEEGKLLGGGVKPGPSIEMWSCSLTWET